MQVILGGALKAGEVAKGLGSVLEQLGHSVANPHTGDIRASGIFVAFVDYLEPELLAGIQDAVDADKPVLCLTDGRLPVASDFLVVCAQAELVDFAYYKAFDDAAEKVVRYVAQKSLDSPSRSVH